LKIISNLNHIDLKTPYVIVCIQPTGYAVRYSSKEEVVQKSGIIAYSSSGYSCAQVTG